MTATTEETLSVSGILLSKTFGQQDASIARFRAINARLAALQIRQAMVGRWFFMIIGTIFTIMPAFVYWLAGTWRSSGDPTPRPPATSSRSRRSRAGCSSRSASCSTSRSRSRARSPCSTGSSSTSRWTPRSSTRPTRSSCTPADVRGQVRFRDVSFQYPTAAVPSHAGARGGGGTTGRGRGGRRRARCRAGGHGRLRSRGRRGRDGRRHGRERETGRSRRRSGGRGRGG